MQTPIPLYVDTIQGNTDYASTLDTSKILYNLNQISGKEYDDFMDYIDKEGKSNLFLAAGRFLAMLSVDYDKRLGNMVILDLRNDIDKVQSVRQWLRNLTNNDSIAIHNFNIAVLKINYEDDYDKFILLEKGFPKP